MVIDFMRYILYLDVATGEEEAGGGDVNQLRFGDGAGVGCRGCKVQVMVVAVLVMVKMLQGAGDGVCQCWIVQVGWCQVQRWWWFFLGFKSNRWVFLSFPFVFSYLTIFFYVDCQKILTKELTSLIEQNTRTNKFIFKKSETKYYIRPKLRGQILIYPFFCPQKLYKLINIFEWKRIIN